MLNSETGRGRALQPDSRNGCLTGSLCMGSDSPVMLDSSQTCSRRGELRGAAAAQRARTARWKKAGARAVLHGSSARWRSGAKDGSGGKESEGVCSKMVISSDGP